MALKYYLVDWRNITDSLIRSAAQTSVDTLRLSDEVQPRAVLKFAGAVPLEVQGLTEFDAAGCRAEMEQAEWKRNVP